MDDRTVIASRLVSLVSLSRAVRPREGRAAARQFVEEAMALLEAEGDLRSVALCLRILGYDAQGDARREVAEAYYTSSLRFCRAIKDAWGTGESLRYLASVASAEGKVAEAEEYTRQALLLLVSVGDGESSAAARRSLARVQPDPSETAEQVPAHSADLVSSVVPTRS